jgi:hypothetical protein
MQFKRIRKSGRDHHQPGNHVLKPWRSDDGKRGGLAAVAYGQKKTWQTRNVVRVIVRDQQRIKMAYLASCRPQGYLRAFAAVDQQRFSLVFKPAAGQPPARQWDHAAGARQANVNHPVQLAFFISKIFLNNFVFAILQNSAMHANILYKLVCTGGGIMVK